MATFQIADTCGVAITDIREDDDTITKGYIKVTWTENEGTRGFLDIFEYVGLKNRTIAVMEAFQCASNQIAFQVEYEPN